MKKFLFNNWAYRLLSLFFAILLFMYVGSTQGPSTSVSDNSNSTQLTSNKAKTFSVPLSLTVNSNKYFVTGYPQRVKIHLNGPSALVTTTANTQNFKAYADLSKLGVGTHTVPIQQEGLNNDLRYRFEPAKIKVNIQPRKTVSYPLQVKYSKANIASGYQAGNATADVKSVKITGASDQINRIHSVVAQLNIPQNAKSSINSQAIIEALDDKQNTVNVVITPATADVTLPITPGNSKELPIKLTPKGITDDNESFTLTSATKRVRVFGTKAQLKKLSVVEVEVDTSDVKNTETKKVFLDSKLNKVKGFDPDYINVKISRNN
ncbi:cell surface protein [Lentilactobacillus fungorum]|jgi:YbbR domain-containing protein|uniref:Cell surface protein n=1 Tax=Lentilactobacillus fungorum TaxID=2201250 RepID=A0ABQ3W234_9LACO|nr:CdaR family protein [Lentilactobacillus fungorum]GHP15118.1 cell surface protein [Lentilactobacillus fungorum]